MGLKTAVLAATVATLSPLVVADNNDMVVLIHGFTRSSKDFQYREELAEAGLDSVAVDVNTFGSDFDRACETFAQVMGTIVDYGACNSAENNRRRFGTDYTGKGLYPEWGPDNHVHVMGHSQGGLTARMLESLLELGSGCEEDTSPLFTGGNKWITSITTLSTPHNGGGSFAPRYSEAQSALLRLYADEETFGFPQYGLTRHESEPFDDFLQRIEASGFFQSEGFAFTGLTESAMKKFNSENRGFPDSYYFAFAAERTSPEERCGLFGCNTVEVPDPEMSFSLRFTASITGSSGPQEERANDGLVSQNNARGPAEEKPFVEVADGDLDTWSKGVWHFVDIGYLDHLQITERNDRQDNNQFQQSGKNLWLSHGYRVKSLPSKSAATTRVDNFERKEKSAAVRRFLEANKVLSQTVEVEAPKASGGAVFGVIVAVFVGSALVSLLAVKGVKKYKTMKANREEEKAVTEHYLPNTTL